jgi:hypothetical protein
MTETEAEAKDAEVKEIKRSIEELRSSINTCVLGCGLEPYKKEMKERSGRFTENIQNNKDYIVTEKILMLEKINDLDRAFSEKIKILRTYIGRMLTSGLIVGVCIVGIFGSIQINKVSQQEYNNHLDQYVVDKSDQMEKFNKFIDSYKDDREKRDDKIDEMFQKQLDFNSSIIIQNGLLEKQLGILRTKLEVH